MINTSVSSTLDPNYCVTLLICRVLCKHSAINTSLCDRLSSVIDNQKVNFCIQDQSTHGGLKCPLEQVIKIYFVIVAVNSDTHHYMNISHSKSTFLYICMKVNEAVRLVYNVNITGMFCHDLELIM